VIRGALKLFAFVAVAAMAACSSGSAHHIQLATLGYDIPADWNDQDTVLRGVTTSVWTPPDNPRHESITVIRSERSPAVAAASFGTLAQLVTDAQAPGAQLSGIRPFVTKSGLRGVRVEAAYVPRGLTAQYRRVHVVLVDQSVLVHVMYTAQTPDPELDALDVVLDSIRHEEA
jgi:hypothetical protein